MSGFVDVGFCCFDVGFWLFGRWILIVWAMNFDWVDVGFWLFEHCIVVVLKVYFGWVDDGFWC